MEVLQPLLINLAVVVIAAVLTAAIAALRAYLKAKLSTEQMAFLDQLANAAVWSVEQTGAGPFASKKSAATAIVAEGLKNRGVVLPAQVVEASIESNVGNSFNYGRLTKDVTE